MKKLEIPKGTRFGRVVVIGDRTVEKSSSRHLCQCDCGNTKAILSNSLLRGKTSSCGCLKRQLEVGQASASAQSGPDRFWAKVDKRSKDECWHWIGKANTKGYGTIRVGGKTYIASRYSYYLEHGHLPDEMLVCHHCDNPPCVNPNHLFLGSYLDNSKDMFSKNRDKHSKGEQCGTSKLTKAQVEFIRTSNQPLRLVAKQLGVTYGHVGKIRRGELWAT